MRADSFFLGDICVRLYVVCMTLSLYTSMVQMATPSLHFLQRGCLFSNNAGIRVYWTGLLLSSQPLGEVGQQ